MKTDEFLKLFLVSIFSCGFCCCIFSCKSLDCEKFEASENCDSFDFLLHKAVSECDERLFYDLTRQPSVTKNQIIGELIGHGFYYKDGCLYFPPENEIRASMKFLDSYLSSGVESDVLDHYLWVAIGESDLRAVCILLKYGANPDSLYKKLDSTLDKDPELTAVEYARRKFNQTATWFGRLCYPAETTGIDDGFRYLLKSDPVEVADACSWLILTYQIVCVLEGKYDASKKLKDALSEPYKAIINIEEWMVSVQVAPDEIPSVPGYAWGHG